MSVFENKYILIPSTSLRHQTQSKQMQNGWVDMWRSEDENPRSVLVPRRFHSLLAIRFEESPRVVAISFNGASIYIPMNGSLIWDAFRIDQRHLEFTAIRISVDSGTPAHVLSRAKVLVESSNIYPSKWEEDKPRMYLVRWPLRNFSNQANTHPKSLVSCCQPCPLADGYGLFARIDGTIAIICGVMEPNQVARVLGRYTGLEHSGNNLAIDVERLNQELEYLLKSSDGFGSIAHPFFKRLLGIAYVYRAESYRSRVVSEIREDFFFRTLCSESQTQPGLAKLVEKHLLHPEAFPTENFEHIAQADISLVSEALTGLLYKLAREPPHPVITDIRNRIETMTQLLADKVKLV